EGIESVCERAAASPWGFRPSMRGRGGAATEAMIAAGRRKDQAHRSHFLPQESAMDRTVVEVPGISEMLKRARVPLSPAVRANGFLFVSGTPPIDFETGDFVTGDIGRQTEQCLLCLQHILETAGSSLAKVCKVVIYASDPAMYGRINEV